MLYITYNKLDRTELDQQTQEFKEYTMRKPNYEDFEDFDMGLIDKV